MIKIRKIMLPRIWLKRNIAGIVTLCMFMPMMPHGCSTMDAHKKHEEKSKVIGNKICPVSSQKIDGKTKVTYNYKGKTYNFCCTSCVDEFKENPGRYIQKIEEEKLQGITQEEEHLSGNSRQHSH